MFFLFNNHFTFYLSYLGMNYSNVIGFLVFLMFLLQFISGMLLSCYYSSFAGFSAVYYMMMDVNVGWLIRFVHVLGASIFMLLILFHWMRGTWISLKLIEQMENSVFGSFYWFSSAAPSMKSSKAPLYYIFKLNMNKNVFNTVSLNWIWISGLLIWFFSLAVSFLGYCLCWGQMSYWGITVMINIFSIIPLFGFYIGSYLWCSSLVVLNKIFMFHFLLGFICVFVLLVHIALLHLYSSFNLVCNNYSILVPFFTLFFKDCFVSFIIFYSMSLLLFCEPDIFGSCDNLVFANPLSTPSHIVPEWYFLVFYCILRAFPNKTMGVFVVFCYFLIVIFLLFNQFFTMLLFMIMNNMKSIEIWSSVTKNKWVWRKKA